MYCTTYEESYSAANSIGRKFLYNSRGLDVISLLVKHYVPLAHINKVIKLCSVTDGRRNREIAIECALYIAPPNASLQIHCRFKL